MKILWISRWDPRQPDDGMLLYTRGLLRGLRNAGASVEVFACPRPISEPRDDEVKIRLFDSPKRWRGWSLLGGLHSDAFRHRSRAMADAICEAIQPSLNAVVFDYFATGWALPIVEERCRELGDKRPALVYISHNHEASLRKRVAREFNGSALMRAVLHIDAAKAAKLENRLVAAADLITTNTDADMALYADAAPNKDYLTLVPAYSGPMDTEREITGDTPRRVIMMGSLEWIAKQENLRRFVAVADAPFREANIELLVLGKADRPFLASIEAASSACRCLGFVDDPAPWLNASRIGLMPDEIGGGFKHRYLNYIFNGVPIATIRSQAVGLPLDPDTAMIAGEDASELVAGILANIDDIDALNRKRIAAFQACRPHFDWNQRGADLKDAIEAAVTRFRAG